MNCKNFVFATRLESQIEVNAAKKKKKKVYTAVDLDGHIWPPYFFMLTVMFAFYP